METISVSDLANFHLRRMNSEIGEMMDGVCIFVDSQIYPPLDAEFRVVIESIRQRTGGPRKRKLDHLIVVLRTRGGVMETVERLVFIMRHHFKKVSFVIPDFAYSAGTVLALSGDDIYMDYFSVLGPIDPQFRDGPKQFPGMGYLTKFEELLQTINDAEDKRSVFAEVKFLLEKFDPAQLFDIEQAVEHGRSLIEGWLPKYKFKDWKVTEGSGKRVTPKMRKDRARSIAETLGDAEKWHSHGRGISIAELQSDQIKLLVRNFAEEMQGLGEAIRNYHDLSGDFYREKRGMNGYIHSIGGVRRVF